MSTADDVRRSLKTLPDTLIDAYAEIFNRIMAHSGNAPQLAVKAFRWLQYSYEPLRSETLLDAITMQVHGCGHFPHNPTVKANELLKACHILIILDERLNVFRFAHLSVVECLDFKLAKVDTHTKIAKVCLSFLCTLDSWYDYDWTLNTEEEHHSERHMFWYAAVFWPWHFGHGGEGCPILIGLWEAFTSAMTHQQWLSYHSSHCRAKKYSNADGFWRRFKMLHKTCDILSTVCVFGLGREFTSSFESEFSLEARIRLKLTTTFKLKSERRDQIDGLLPDVCTLGDLEVAQNLLDVGAHNSSMCATTQSGG